MSLFICSRHHSNVFYLSIVSTYDNLIALFRILDVSVGSDLVNWVIILGWHSHQVLVRTVDRQSFNSNELL